MLVAYGLHSVLNHSICGFVCQGWKWLYYGKFYVTLSPVFLQVRVCLCVFLLKSNRPDCALPIP